MAPYPEALEIRPVYRPIDAVVTVPGSKSITNRALILAALAEGRSTLTGALFSDDTRHMEDSLQRLGIGIRSDEAAGRFEIEGAGGRIPAASAELFIGNSGTSARFLTAFCALGHGRYRIDGVERMRQRPIRDLIAALSQLGVDAIAESGCPPVEVKANGLRGGSASLRGEASSQYLTALLLVAPLSTDGVTIRIQGELASKPYVDMTLRMMREWGAAVENDSYREFQIPGRQAYRAREYAIEPDASSASYFFAAAAVTGGRVRVNGLGRDSMQGDLGFAELLRQMGCHVEIADDYVEVQGQTLHGIDADMNAISDTVMTLAAIAPFADSPTTIRNVGHIRVKETDRLHAVATELHRLGVEVDEREDGLTILPAQSLNPAEIETYDDHRMAMAFSIIGLRSPRITILNPNCVSKTFPGFFELLEELYN